MRKQSGKDRARVGEKKRRKMANLLVLQKPAESLQDSEEKLEQTGPTCRSWQGRQSRLCQKKKEQIHLSTSPDREAGESQGKQERGGLKGVRAIGRKKHES